ncbi:tyrosine-protein phosphatase non-receptor type 4-like isoform X7 [Crassostrea angulata]|uniref:tyrosine-protein phosphatase non-receptor type 4-like isoform X7 n=1 Tax=Magallana angulata TaxID=2784310 RepID=UPI00148AB0BB|nr:tyrosine-protein phosphatase non-receptor type 4 isoform X4 [Crassostrea gigas]XP_052682171.1 tyrosine-protein phosphatase non-receptor type 4-like isoform X7 [Crassostrea angulata]
MAALLTSQSWRALWDRFISQMDEKLEILRESRWSPNRLLPELHSMSMRLVSAGGTYNVRASEMSSHLQDRQPKMVTCIVHFLDDSQQDFEVDKKAKSQVLLDKVFGHLELVEKDYFGLQFVDLSPAPDGMISHAHHPVGPYAMRWLDPLKTIKKQCRGPPYEFYFRVKFYVSDPSKLEEEYTSRYHFFLQVKRDILEGRLVTPPSTAALLASFAIQSELGDYNPDEHKGNYISDYRFIPHQTEDFEKQVSELHKQHRGQTPADAEYHYLDKAKRLEMYGVDLHNARVLIDREIPINSPFYDQSNIDIQLGVTSVGLVVFQNNVKINTFPWAKIVKISFKRKQFFIQLRREMNDSVENLIGFNMVSYRSCKNLWKSCVEHHTFFRLYVPNPPSKKIFSMGSKFRYSGKTEFQTLEENKRRAKIERTFSRSPSKKFARRTVSGHTRDQIIQERNFIDGHRNLPKSQTFGGTPSTARPKSSNSVNHSFNRYESINNQKRATLPHDYKVGSNSRSSIHSSKSDDDGGFISHKISANTYPQPVPIKVVDVNIPDKDNHVDPNTDLPVYDDYLPNGNSHTDGHGLVTIRMRPDDQGRFGFNVKGGADQGMPIIVSRVAPGTPADIAIPRLNEGDQVLFINGRDVSQHTHEQVVMFIRASRETHSGELVLIVRPNVYVGEEAQEEPNLEYLPDNYQIIAPQGTGTNALEASLMLLQESLDSGAALAQFEQLYRKKPGMTMNAARLDDNIAKNRYRDISPYDQTRVILKEQNTSGGDYINANYVNMEIPGSGIVNRYIAAQGPLPKTCTDFWQMVWEQHSSLVVMLTTKVEKGRVKCHQYWPEMYETMDYGLLQITCVKEEETPSFAFREFNLTHVETSEERHISHMQYIAWPDHNVPDDPADFLEFVLKVRQRRMGMVEPTIVHCSAGIGRTGVLITMETAMCLIEANQPVYPLSIVRQMRDQRAMLIQTATQYKFVCEAILKVFSEELVKPLEDYSR